MESQEGQEKGNVLYEWPTRTLKNQCGKRMRKR